MVLLPLLGLLAGAGIAVALLQALSNDPTGSPAEAADQHDSGSIVLDAQQYIGRTIDEVVRRLTRLGLDVEPRGEVRDDVAPDEVTGVEPNGKPLAAGDTVVVTYATGAASGGGARNRPAVTGAADSGTAEEEADPVTIDGPAPEPPGTPARTTAPAETLPATSSETESSASETTTEATGSESGTPTSTPATTTATTATAG
jgi:serine/threonine-protein kinase